jgi:PhnB protein
MPPGSEKGSMYDRLDGTLAMASDAMIGQPYEGMKNFSLALYYITAAEVQQVFDVPTEGGRLTMPMRKMFWAEALGMLVDHFGTPGMINGAEIPG